jgi:hypothetical protein
MPHTQTASSIPRVVALDFLRGVMLLMMMLDHAFFMGFTQWTAAQEWLYGFFGYITAAEGFYFLSGLVCSLVFHRGFLRVPRHARPSSGNGCGPSGSGTWSPSSSPACA